MDKDLKRTLGIALKKMDEIKSKDDEDFFSSERRLARFTELLFTHVLYRAAKGNPEGLIAYLRSEWPLSFDRKSLANRLETALQKRSRGGNRHDPAVHSYAAQALRLYDLWHEENIKQGVNDWGRANDMKDETAKIVFETEMREAAHAGSSFPWQQGDTGRQLGLPANNFEAVREAMRDLMDRPTRLKSKG